MTDGRPAHAEKPADPGAMLAAFLAANDAPCPVCGYNLRGLTGDRCPECGRPLVLAVGTTEPRLAAFIAGLVGLSCGLGFSAILLAWIAAEALFGRRGFFPSLLEVGLLLSGAVVGGIGVIAWVRLRRRLGRLRQPAKWAWAGAAWLVGVTFPVLFLLEVR